jgi:hypothetical protein
MCCTSYFPWLDHPSNIWYTLNIGKDYDNGLPKWRGHTVLNGTSEQLLSLTWFNNGKEKCLLTYTLLYYNTTSNFVTTTSFQVSTYPMSKFHNRKYSQMWFFSLNVLLL